MQRRHHGLKHLKDDRARDVGHDAQREHRHVRQSATGEQVQQGHSTRSHRGTGIREKARYPLEGDTGHGNVRTETVQHKHGDGENDLAAQLFDRECVFKTS